MKRIVLIILSAFVMTLGFAKTPEKSKSMSEVKEHRLEDRYLLEAIGNLQQLRHYDPSKNESNSDFIIVRQNFFNRAIVCLEKAKAKSSDGATKQKLQEIISYLRVNERAILKTDAKFKRTTAEGARHIDHCVNVLLKFTN